MQAIRTQPLTMRTPLVVENRVAVSTISSSQNLTNLAAAPAINYS